MSDIRLAAGSCRLCLQPKPLIGSHIVPHWIWKILKQSAPDFANPGSALTGAGQYFKASGYNGQVQRGQSELVERLFCAECDHSFSHLEKIFSKYRKRSIRCMKPSTDRAVTRPRTARIPYAQCKLFSRLNIWRMAIIALPEYEEVQLSSEIIDDLRARTISKDAGAWHQYPVRIELER